MVLIHFLNGLAFAILGVASYLQLNREVDFPLKKELPWLVAFGLVGGISGWLDMLIASEASTGLGDFLRILRMIVHPLTGLLLFRFGWGVLAKIHPLPTWTIFIPGILLVPTAFVITYASTTFITPSPIEIPIDIWSRYLLYLPGSLMAGLGFTRQWDDHRKEGLHDVSRLMLGAGIAFLFEAFVVGLVVPAAPYGPASYYNYDRVLHNAFLGESQETIAPYGLITWLDYDAVLTTTGLPIEFWRMASALVVTFFVVKSLDVFEAIRKRQIQELEDERDRALQSTLETQIAARQSAENWTNTLVSISQRIVELENVDDILVLITKSLRPLLRADVTSLAIYNQETAMLELKCYANQQKAELVGHPPVNITNPIIVNSFHSAESYLSQEGDNPDLFANICYCSEIRAKAIAVVPLVMKNTPIGALWIARCDGESFTRTDLIWLDSMADQVVISIQHGLMTSQLQSLSIIEERGRIAREMHDGLAQILGYLNLQIQTLASLMEQGKMGSFQKNLTQMREAVQTAHADVRENILSLRTTLAQDKGLIVSMYEYLSEFGIQTGIGTSFTNHVEGEFDLASVAEVQLVCILREALTNTRKHAQANEVRVEIDKITNHESTQIRMTVQDDGVGFSLANSKRSFGLQTMRERAESISGNLTVHSEPGKGTTIECWIPCLPQEEIQQRSIVIE